MPLFLQVLKFSGCFWGLPLRYNATQRVMVSDVSKALFSFKSSEKNYPVPRHYILMYSYPLPAINRRLSIGWWLTPFMDVCHGVCLCIGRQVYADFSKFLPEITFPLPSMHLWKWILPMKRNYSVCGDKYTDSCATWGFKHNRKNPPRENWICNYLTRLRAGRTGFRIMG
jgi:hypothetical protein